MFSTITSATVSIPLCQNWDSQQRSHTKPSDGPLLPTHPRVPVIILSQVWGVADSLVQSSPPQMQVAAEARNTWTL